MLVTVLLQSPNSSCSFPGLSCPPFINEKKATHWFPQGRDGRRGRGGVHTLFSLFRDHAKLTDRAVATYEEIFLVVIGNSSYSHTI